MISDLARIVAVVICGYFVSHFFATLWILLFHP